MYLETIKELIDKKIDELKSKKKKLATTLTLDKINSLISLIEKVQENYKNLKDLDLLELKEHFNIENKYLTFYQIIINHNQDLKPSDITLLNKVLTSNLTIIKDEKEKISKVQKENQEIDDEIKKLQKLKEKVENFLIDENDIDTLSLLLSETNNYEEAINIMKYLLLTSLKKKIDENNKEDFIEVSKNIKYEILNEIATMQKMTKEQIVQDRYDKFRNISYFKEI